MAVHVVGSVCGFVQSPTDCKCQYVCERRIKSQSFAVYDIHKNKFSSVNIFIVIQMLYSLPSSFLS